MGNGSRFDSGYAEIRSFKNMAAIAETQAHPSANRQVCTGAVDEVRSRERAALRTAKGEGIRNEDQCARTGADKRTQPVANTAAIHVRGSRFIRVRGNAQCEG